jgi:inositol phosphorylceramide mannosyltransferase catalytic subunit
MSRGVVSLRKRLERFASKSPADKWTAIKWHSIHLPRVIRAKFGDSYRRRQIFRDIYKDSHWGSAAGSKFFSGIGSRGDSAEIYVESMAALLVCHAADLGRPLTVVDLGCGDFEIGRALVARVPNLRYVGCDIVPELIAHNAKMYANDRIGFRQIDIVSDPLPAGDACLLRQVLQHLSNAEIKRLVERLDYKYIYVTEGQPATRIGPFNPDKATNSDVRFDWLAGRGRGVELDKPPFCLITEEVLRTSERPNEIIVTERVVSRSEGDPVVSRQRTPARGRGAGEIPAVIFQTWKSKVEIPSRFAQWMSTFDSLNPHFRHILWDDQDNRKFIASYYEWFLPIYHSYPKEIYRADAIRYFYFYMFGGIYSDMDSECLKPLEGLLGRADVLLGRMGSADHPDSIPNATMASKPRQDFWLLVIWMMIVASVQTPLPRPEAVTGPIVLKSAADLYLRQPHSRKVASAIREIANLLPLNIQPVQRASKVEILPNREWFPIDWSDPVHLRFIETLEKQALDDASKKCCSHIRQLSLTGLTPGDC